MTNSISSETVGVLWTQASQGLGLIELCVNDARGVLLSAPALTRLAAGADVRFDELARLAQALGVQASAPQRAPSHAPGATLFAEPAANAKLWLLMRTELAGAWAQAMGPDDAGEAVARRAMVNPSSNRVIDVLMDPPRLRARLTLDSPALQRAADPFGALDAIFDAWVSRLENLGVKKLVEIPAVSSVWRAANPLLLAKLQEAQLDALSPELKRAKAPRM
jgi:hypothetical protein